jgi:hypothetical protein
LWNTGTLQKIHGEKTCSDSVVVIPARTWGFYHLNGKSIDYYANESVTSTIVEDRSLAWNWFASFAAEDMMYFARYNVLFLTHLCGEHDYIWWWNLSLTNQQANIQQPAYFNGEWNATLTIRRATDRYAVVSHYGFDDDSSDSSDDVESASSEDPIRKKSLTIIFDTKTLTIQEHTRAEIEQILGDVTLEMPLSELQDTFLQTLEP